MAQLVRTMRLNTLIRFERKTRPAGRGHAGEEIWAKVDDVWAEVQDVLPSRGERLSEGMTMEARPARIRMRYRDDITSDMRIVIGGLDQPDDPPPAGRRIMAIVAGPATLGRMAGLEMMAEEYSTAGAGA